MANLKWHSTDETTFTWYILDGPLWWRIKMAGALLLSPLTIIFLGHSIRVKYPPRREGD